MSTELTADELLALADDNYVGWEEDAREALRDAALNAKLLQNRAVTAEPPRIEDLAPGTTFGDGKHRYTDEPILLREVRRDDGQKFYADEFDPSTIRDVQPPARREED